MNRKALAFPSSMIGLGLITLLATSTACSQRPTQEINAAEQAVADAKSNELAPYISDELMQLAGERLMLIRTVHAQDASRTLIRDYSAPRRMAQKIQADTQMALVLGAQRRTDAQSDAAAAVDEAQSALQQTHDQLNLVRTRAGRIGAAAAARELATLDRLMDTAQEAMVDQDYLSAVARARAVNAKAERLQVQIEAVAIRAGEHHGTQIATN